MVEQKFDVFLCHNSEDKAAVTEIAEQLRRRGIKPWLDVWELQPGAIWQFALEQQIERIGAVAVFVGQKGIGPWQSEEIYAFLQEFIRRDCPVIPVMLSETQTQPLLPIFLRSRHWVDFRSLRPDPLDQLIWGITGQRLNKTAFVDGPSSVIDSADKPYEVKVTKQSDYYRRPKEIVSEYAKSSSNDFPPADTADDLSSEMGIDYSYLRSLLKSRDWVTADHETYAQVCELLGKEENMGFFDPEELLSFPCSDLKTMDMLWRRYSDDRFGFSVQKRIYLSCGGQRRRDSSELWAHLCNEFGWNATYNESTNFIFDITAPVGHLPSVTKEIGTAFYTYAKECAVFSFIHRCRI